MRATRSMQAASATLDPPNLCTRHAWSAADSGFITSRLPVVGQEALVRLVVLIQLEPVVEAGEERLEGVRLQRRDLEGGQHASEIRAVVAVVKEADVPAPADRIQKMEQRTRTLRKLEPADSFRGDGRRPPADHVAYVQLGHLVARQVRRFVSRLPQPRGQLGA